MKTLAIAMATLTMLALQTQAMPSDRTSLLHLSHVHRGGGKLERPDNTLDTFMWCWQNGSALECD